MFGLKFCVHGGYNKNWFGALEGQKQSAWQIAGHSVCPVGNGVGSGRTKNQNISPSGQMGYDPSDVLAKDVKDNSLVG